MSEPFTLPRIQRRPHGDSRATADDLTGMENRIMAALEDAVAALQQAVNEANSRFQNVGELQNALDEERAKYDALVSSEAEEDVAQNQELADARAATDAAVNQLNQVAGVLTGLTEQVNSLGRTASEQTAEATAAPADQPAESPAPDQSTTEAPADQAAPSESTTVDTEVSQTETASPTDTTTETLSDLQPQAPTPGDTPADVGDTSAPADAGNAGTADASPTDAGAAANQGSDTPAPGQSTVDNANENPDTSSDPTDVSNMRPNL